jgi:hypothetical protein
MWMAASGVACGGDAPRAVGESCSTGANCSSGHCIDDIDFDRRFCTGPCMSDAECGGVAPTCSDYLAQVFDWAMGSLWCIPL